MVTQVALRLSMEVRKTQTSKKQGRAGASHSPSITHIIGLIGAVEVVEFGPACSFLFHLVTSSPVPLPTTSPHSLEKSLRNLPLKPGLIVIFRYKTPPKESSPPKRILSYTTAAIHCVGEARPWPPRSGRGQEQAEEQRGHLPRRWQQRAPRQLPLSAPPIERVGYQPQPTPYSMSFIFSMSSSVSGVQPPQEHRKPYVEYRSTVDPP